MTIAKTIYSVAKADLSGYAYLSGGDVVFDQEVPRRSGSFDNVNDADKMLNKFRRALAKSTDKDIKQALAWQTGPFASPSLIAASNENLARHYKHSETEFTVVRVTVEELTR